MKQRPDFSLLVPIDDISGDTQKDTHLLQQMAEEAQGFLRSFGWCTRVEKGWFGWGVGSIAAVFLFEIVPSSPAVDRVLWVIVGDLPSAYLVVDDIPTPLEALKTYVELMEDWIAAVRAGNSTDDCIPVNQPATREVADALEVRLEFVRKQFLSNTAPHRAR